MWRSAINRMVDYDGMLLGHVKRQLISLSLLRLCKKRVDEGTGDANLIRDIRHVF